MKTFQSFLIFFLFHSFLSGQTNLIENRKEIELLFNKAYIDQNISISYGHVWKKHAVSIGIKSHLNFTEECYKGNFFRERGYAKNIKETIGLNAGYRYDLFENKENIIPYLFLNVQMSYLSISHPFEYTDFSGSQQGVTHYHVTFYFGPLFIVENTCGIGLTTKIFKNWYLNQGVGIGITTIPIKGINFTPPRNIHLDITTLLRIGLTYRI